MPLIVPIFRLNLTNKPRKFYEFKNVRALQSWIFKNVEIWETDIKNFEVHFQTQSGREDMPVVIHDEVLCFKDGITLLNIATRHDFFSCLKANSFNMLKMYELPRSFLKTRKGKPGWINRFFMLTSFLRKQA